ncbi:advillin isoform X2 [Aethina tumida]|uniref:advillin isoform X2 n=1 Tax=Aethina tumida TaxID=116153 RepID=UPI00096AF1CB|nr:advillin isoform X2 [Aethina tumida]
MISDELYKNGTNGGVLDAAFRKVNRNSTGFAIWRVESMSLVAVPRDQYGIFFDTDSYIIYAASLWDQPAGTDTVSKEIKGGNLEYHIHFWLGTNTTPEKSGVAAYKSVELDNLLNTHSTQHRETQGNESSRFLSYFKNGFKVLKADLIMNGIKSHPKLYKIKGKRKPVLTEMTNVSWDHFNSSEVFILRTEKTLYIWIGRAANAVEKMHATKICLEMKDELKVDNIVFVDDGYEKTMNEDFKKDIDRYLPLDKRHILPENGNNEDANTLAGRSNIRLYKCSESNGKYRVAELGTGPFLQSDLNSDDVYILDHEANGIWVWVGKRAPDKERSEGLRNARGFVKKKKYPSHTKVTRVVDGHEPTEFKMLFPFWKSEQQSKLNKPKMLVSKFDAETMEDRPFLAAETQLIDDGSGSITIWRVRQNNIVEIPKERHGFFFSGDCYIILYSYQPTTELKHLLYCWLGSHATQEDINCTTQKVGEIDDELGHLGFQARLIQGRETAHFLQLFGGKFIVFKGKGSDFDDSGRNLKNPSQYMLQIFGSTLYSSKAVQVHAKASSLNSNYCFVIKRGKKSHVWCGNYSTGDQREMAKLFAGKDFELVLEGKEKDDFFNLIGGKAPYATQLIKNDADPRLPRLFNCSSSLNNFKVEEILHFTQKDLIPENIMLLDMHDCLYIWIGKLSSREDQRLSIQMAIEYLQSDPAGRDMNIAIINIKQGKEPPTFIGLFPTWDRKCWKHYKSFGKIRHDIEATNTNNNGKTNGWTQEKSGHSDFDQFDKYPINILKGPNDKLPARIDPLNKELHLTHDDFVTLFKMIYVDFEKLPRWKQQELKKKVGLF